VNILHLDSSITGENSASRALSAAIVRKLADADPSADIRYRDLVEAPFDHLTLPGYATGQSQEALGEFLAADTIVIGATMYNFTISTQLKAWLDRVLVAGQTFRYTENGPQGLAGGKRVFVALARGGLYGEDTPLRELEHAERYLRTVLNFIGIADPVFVIAEGLALGEMEREGAMQLAQRRIAALWQDNLVH